MPLNPALSVSVFSPPARENACALLLANANTSCKNCSRSEATWLNSVCIATRLHARSEDSHQDKAVLIVGEAPGYDEDEANCNFVGPSGRHLSRHYVRAHLLPRYADIYAANAVRCATSNNSTPSKRERTACRRYLANDLGILSRLYKQVVILAVGSTAVQSLCNRRLMDQFRRQGEPITMEGLEIEFPLFATWHPAATFIGRDPRKLQDVRRHVGLLVEYLRFGRLSTEQAPTPVLCPSMPDGWDGQLTFDLETFICLREAVGSPCPETSCRTTPKSGCRSCKGVGTTQLCFHPLTIQEIDGIPIGRQIICAGIAWNDPTSVSREEKEREEEGGRGRIRTGYFDFSDSSQVERFFQWMRHAVSISGQNLPFDLKLIRAMSRGTLESKRVGRSIPDLTIPGLMLEDSQIETFLADDIMPERTLDAISRDYRLDPYSGGKSPVHEFDSTTDERLIYYVCKDAFNTRRACQVAQWIQGKRYSSHPVACCKQSLSRRRWTSNLLRTRTLLEEAGVCFDVGKLRKLHDQTVSELDRMVQEAASLFDDLILAGAGSRACAERLVASAARLITASIPLEKRICPTSEVEMLLGTVANLAITKKTGSVSTDKDNRAALLGALPRDNEECRIVADKLERLSEYRETVRLVDAYTRTYLRGKRSGPYYQAREVPVAVPSRHCVLGIEDGRWHASQARSLWDAKGRAETKCGAAVTYALEEKRSPDCPECAAAVRTSKSATRRVRVPGSKYYRYNRKNTLVRPPPLPDSLREAETDTRELGMSFPSYFIVSQIDEATGKRSGTAGTTRWSAERIQTNPEQIERCYTTRFNPGVLGSWDLKQAEWRMAMWLANDAVGLAEIANGFDVHRHAAEFLLGWRFSDFPAWVTSAQGEAELRRFPHLRVREAYAEFRRGPQDDHSLGVLRGIVLKVLRDRTKSGANFPELYGAEAATTQRSLRRQMGIEIPLSRCEDFHRYKEEHYPARHAWRCRLWRQAARDGAVHLPICGWSRSFGNALTQQEVIDVYRNKILDHPVQSHAFCILISAVGEVQVAFLERGMYSVVCLQMHDGLVVDMPLREEKEAKAIVDQKLKENWYLRKLEELHECRKFPLEYDYKEMARYDGRTE